VIHVKKFHMKKSKERQDIECKNLIFVKGGTTSLVEEWIVEVPRYKHQQPRYSSATLTA
jgi:hypothetical protein